jgi:hypothetical protein
VPGTIGEGGCTISSIMHGLNLKSADWRTTYPTRVISHYDAKAVTAHLPVLGARLVAINEERAR